MRQLVWSSLIVGGILITLFGIGIDYLLPGTSPGLNLPQLFVVAAGLTISLLAARLRRGKLFRGDTGGLKRMLAVATVVLVTLLVLEIVLVAWGMPTYFHAYFPEYNYPELPWWTCDDAGCHLIYEEVKDCMRSWPALGPLLPGKPTGVCGFGRLCSD